MALLKELGMDYLKLRRNILVPTMAMDLHVCQCLTPHVYGSALHTAIPHLSCLRNSS